MLSKKIPAGHKQLKQNRPAMGNAEQPAGCSTMRFQSVIYLNTTGSDDMPVKI